MKPLIPSVIIDCDPGADDFFALLWALGLHKKGTIRILAITTTGGNVWAEITYKNALRAYEFLDIIDIPVGKSDIIVRSPDASHIHGSDGLGEASKYLPRVRIPKTSLSSSTLLETIIKKHPDVQILTFWPLTNIAQVLKKKSTQLELSPCEEPSVYQEMSRQMQNLMSPTIQNQPIQYLPPSIIVFSCHSTSRASSSLHAMRWIRYSGISRARKQNFWEHSHSIPSRPIWLSVKQQE